MLMHAGDRGVDRHHPIEPARRVGLPLHLGEQPVPGAVVRPPGEPLIDRVPLPEPLRQITPRRTRPVLPRHPLNRETMIRPRPRPPRHRRHQRLQNGPHLVRDLATRHPSRLAHRPPKPLDQHGLAVTPGPNQVDKIRLASLAAHGVLATKPQGFRAEAGHFDVGKAGRSGASFGYRLIRRSARGWPQVHSLREWAPGSVSLSRLDEKRLRVVTSRTFCTMLGV